ncbi:MAG: tripartite tricarboxylate transporter substrate binding protein [Reyranellaceae bacterium]
MRRRQLIGGPLAAAALVSALGAAPGAARAESWPSRPLRIVVPFAPGGSGDITARLIGKYIEEQTGQPVVVDNRPGANGIIGTMAVKSAPADGYTVLLATTTVLGANLALYKSLPYDPRADFRLVGTFGDGGGLLVVSADSPFQTLDDLLAQARAQPGALFYGHFNSSSLVPAELLADCTKLGWTGVAYKQVGNATADLMGGRLHFIFLDNTAAHALVSAGKLRVLAITRVQREAQRPDVPALAERCSGFEVTGYLGLAVRSETPLEIARRLNQLVNDGIFAPEMNARLQEFGTVPKRMTLDEAAAYQREQADKWVDYVRIAKIEPQ